MILLLRWRNRRRLDGDFCGDPRSCVIYLRTTKNTPDVEEVELKLPDGQVYIGFRR